MTTWAISYMIPMFITVGTHLVTQNLEGSYPGCCKRRRGQRPEQTSEATIRERFSTEQLEEDDEEFELIPGTATSSSSNNQPPKTTDIWVAEKGLKYHTRPQCGAVQQGWKQPVAKL